MKWQPYETAPKTGEPFLAYFPFAKEFRVVYWDNRAFWFAGKAWIEEEEDIGFSHWMPLPEAPQSSWSVK